MTAQNLIEITFAHPRGSNTRKIRCSPSVTAAQAIEQLVKIGFLEAPGETSAYALVTKGDKDKDKGKNIPPNASLESAGVRDGDTVAVTEANSLAAGGAPCLA